MNSLKYFIIALIAIPSLTASGQSKVDKKAEKAYTVHYRGSYMQNVIVRKDTIGLQNIIQIQAVNFSGGAGRITPVALRAPGDKSPVLPGAEISDISVLTGRYNSIRETMKTPKGMTIRLIDVEYPFRFNVTISNQILDLEIKEPGFWLVSVKMAQ